jgi:hypothetical protein
MQDNPAIDRRPVEMKRLPGVNSLPGGIVLSISQQLQEIEHDRYTDLPG